MEVLKQGQYSPMDEGDQIVVLYAAINDYMADIKIEDVKRFEKELITFVDNSYPQIKRRIKETGKLDDETAEFLVDAINAFKRQFE